MVDLKRKVQTQKNETLYDKQSSIFQQYRKFNNIENVNTATCYNFVDKNFNSVSLHQYWPVSWKYYNVDKRERGEKMHHKKLSFKIGLLQITSAQDFNLEGKERQYQRLKSWVFIKVRSIRFPINRTRVIWTIN